jgi:hypothetical protein
MNRTLHNRSTAVPGSNDAQFLSLAIAGVKDSLKWHANEGCDDEKHAVTPAPIDMI